MNAQPSLAAAEPFGSMPLAARRLLRLMKHLPVGHLELRLPDGATLHLPGSTGSSSGPSKGAHRDPRGVLVLKNWAMFARAIKSGDIGFAESFIDGDWDSPDLPQLLRLCLLNRNHLEELVYGSWWGRLGHRLRHLMRRNSRSGSARNIHAHYDLGNGFYRLWLDRSMSYSAAWFEGRDPKGCDLLQAQQAKYRRALRETRIEPGQRVLEIGCGWGGLAETAARDFGAQVTGITLSIEQLNWAQQRMQDAGLADQARLRYLDYRDLPALYGTNPFDAVVSIEMFEAVGHEYWSDYFQALNACLKPGGRACIQTITIRDDLFSRYLRSTDFIQQYIFPGGLLPSPSAFEAEARRAGFVVEGRLAFGHDYAETLRRWRDAFLANLDAVQRQGFDRRFQRIWTFYLAYCEAAFDADNTDVIQFTLRKPSP